MKENKFRYIFKHEIFNDVSIYYFTLKEIEEGKLNNVLKSGIIENRYRIVARDAYIGLKDKNKKDIYLGDILLTTSDMVNWSTGKKTGKISKVKSEVVWSNKITAFCKKENNKISNFAMHSDLIQKYSEVIGNIYENPEMK